MSTALDTKLGREFRLYLGKLVTSTLDADFDRVTNENDLKLKIEVSTTDVPMKENGGQIATITGSKSYELTAETARVFTDAAGTRLVDNIGVSYPIQLRVVTYDDTGEVDEEKVAVEGKMLVTTAEFGAPTDGAQTISFTLKGSGNLTVNISNPRAIV